MTSSHQELPQTPTTHKEELVTKRQTKSELLRRELDERLGPEEGPGKMKGAKAMKDQPLERRGCRAGGDGDAEHCLNPRGSVEGLLKFNGERKKWMASNMIVNIWGGGIENFFLIFFFPKCFNFSQTKEKSYFPQTLLLLPMFLCL